MSSKFFLSFLGVILFSCIGASKGLVNFEVVHGDLVSKITIDKNKGSQHIIFQNNRGAYVKNEMSKKNYNYIIKSINELKGTPNDVKFCHRFHVEVKYAGKKRIGCIGSKSKFARELTQLLRLINILI